MATVWQVVAGTRRWGTLLGFLLVSTCTPPPHAPSEAEIAARLGPDAPLLPLFEALSAREANVSRTPLVILQIGDSHTANDSFSGHMREQFQARFGDGGRGILPPGVPYRYYRPDRVTVAARGWRVDSSFHASTAGPFGITGLRQHADDDAEMTLSAPAPGDMATVAVEVLRQPGGGTVDVSLDTGVTAEIETQAPSPQAALLPIAGTATTHSVKLRARGDGPVDILAWEVTRGTGGVIYANLGTIGASVDIMHRWDTAIVHAELAHLAPAMIVLAFGTNEGFRDSTDPAAYEAAFAARLQDLHAAAPGAALVVLGPPDGDRRRAKRSAEPAACGDPEWTLPSRLAEVRAAQRAASARQNAYFWDWSRAMGGTCSMMRWAADKPPLAAPDHVHLFAPGYQATANALFRVLMAGYAKYRALLPAI